MEENINKKISIKEAAKLCGLESASIFFAIRRKKLKAVKQRNCFGKGFRWIIDIEDFKQYRNNLYSRENACFEGELIFDKKKGFYSVIQSAKLLDVTTQKIYNSIRNGNLPAKTKGTYWVIHVDHLKRFKEKYMP